MQRLVETATPRRNDRGSLVFDLRDRRLVIGADDVDGYAFVVSYHRRERQAQ